MAPTVAAEPLAPEGWVDAHGDYLFRFALARIRNSDSAQDVVQESLLAALTARHSFRGKCSERSWLTAILKRKIIDRLRANVRDQVAREVVSDEWADRLFTGNGKWRQKPSEWSDDEPGSAITRADFRSTLDRCLNRLPRRLRHAFVLRHIDERHASDVCEAVGASETNLWVMLHRARLRLWRCLTIHWFGEESANQGEDES